MDHPEVTSGREDHLSRLRRVYELYFPAVYRYVFGRVGNQADAEDLTSQVFLKAVRWLDSEQDDAAVRRWLWRTARSTVAEFWEKAYHLPSLSLYDRVVRPLVAAPSNGSPATELEDLLNHLSDRYRRVLELRFLHGHTVKETAAILGISEANVKVLQYRALKRAAQGKVAADGRQPEE